MQSDPNQLENGATTAPELRSLLVGIRMAVENEVHRIAPISASPYLNRPDAAAWFGCSVSKIDQFRMDGRLKPKYLGDQPLYRKADIEALMEDDTIKVRRKLGNRQLKRAGLE